MIKELEGKNYFFQADELFKKYFCDRTKTETEKNKENELYNLIFEFYKKVYNNEATDIGFEFFGTGFFGIGYLDNYGYYELSDGDRGHYNVEYYGEDTHNVFIKAINDALFHNGCQYELGNRQKLKQDFEKRFGYLNFEALYGLEENKYFSLLYTTEYQLAKWSIYYEGNIPQEVIQNYENYLNGIWWSKGNHITWQYNLDTKQFTCKKNVKAKKLKKVGDK